MASTRQQIREMIRTEGVLRTTAHAARFVLELASDKWMDRQLGIESNARVSVEQLGLTDPNAEKYAPTDYKTVAPVLSYLDIREGSNEVFLDYGSGKGRMLILAARLPFRRVIGIDLSPSLNEDARRNIQNTNAKLRCAQIDVLEANAMEFEVPVDVTVAYFYSPFTGDTLRGVLTNLEASLKASPRRLRLVFKDPSDFEKEVSAYPWLQLEREFKTSGQHDRMRYVVYQAQLVESGD